MTSFFFLKYTATPETYTLSLHDALPISVRAEHVVAGALEAVRDHRLRHAEARIERAVEEGAQAHVQVVFAPQVEDIAVAVDEVDRRALQPHVGHHGEPEAGREVRHLRRAALPVVFALRRLQRRETLPGRQREGAVAVGDRHAARDEELPAERIGDRAGRARGGEI